MEYGNNTVVFKVEPNQNGKLIREFLQDKDISAKALKKLRYSGKILCNGIEVTWRKIVTIGDEIVLIYPEKENNSYLKPEPVSLEVIFQDRDIVLVNKQAGLCVHPTLAHPSGTLANGLLYQWMVIEEKASFHAMNRLDQDTSGLVLVAKNAFSAQQLFLQRQQKKISRSYLAMVHGKINDQAGCINQPLQRCEGRTTKRKVCDAGQSAITYYEVLERLNDCTLIKLTPKTGRTHQIRVHMAYLGHPLVGDELYGGSTEKISRQCLHADKISFFHPRSGESLSFQIPLAKDIEKLLERIRETI